MKPLRNLASASKLPNPKTQLAHYPPYFASCAEKLPEDVILNRLPISLDRAGVAYLIITVSAVIAHVVVNHICFEPTGSDMDPVGPM
jgi:hypothetical protein